MATCPYIPIVTICARNTSKGVGPTCRHQRQRLHRSITVIQYKKPTKADARLRQARVKT